MGNGQTLRVAAAQFHVGADVEANLATSLRMLDEAAATGAALVVLPEFCNHLSWYNDKQHCYEVSVALDGPFLAAISAKAKALGVYVVVNCTVQREGGTTTGSSLLYSPEGELLADNTKQIYIGHENDFLERATEAGPIVDSPIGRIGLYACMDGVINETPRTLALNGAQLMLNSLNSFATDEASLHIPVRAAENKVYVIAANKIGPLVPEEMIEGISQATGIPVRFLSGAGESQVVAPDGTVLAKASLDREEVIVADIEPGQADIKLRPDGTDIFASRRPELYSPIVASPADQCLPPACGSEPVRAAAVQLSGSFKEEELWQRLEEADAPLVVLPPLPLSDDSSADADYHAELLAGIQERCNGALVCTAAVREGGADLQYGAVLVSDRGIEHFQPQVHASERCGFSALANEFSCFDSPLGRIAVITSDDSLYPETFRLLAMQGAEIALVPLMPLEAWELETGLLERSAENRINLVAAVGDLAFGGGLATALQTDFTVMTPWAERDFDGLLSQPELSRFPAEGGVFTCELRPANAYNKVVSSNTDLLANRPWEASAAIARPQA